MDHQQRASGEKQSDHLAEIIYITKRFAVRDDMPRRASKVEAMKWIAEWRQRLKDAQTQ